MCKIRLITDPALRGVGSSGDAMRRCLRSSGLGAELLELVLDDGLAAALLGR